MAESGLIWKLGAAVCRSITADIVSLPFPSSSPRRRRESRSALDTGLRRYDEGCGWCENLLRRFPRGPVVLALRPVEPVMVAQHGAFVFGAEQTAALQQRDDLAGKRIELQRQERRHHIEAVGRTAVKPVDHQIGDLLGRAGGHVMAARPGQVAEQLAQ